MYDAMLDDLEDDVTSATEDTLDLHEKADGQLDIVVDDNRFADVTLQQFFDGRLGAVEDVAVRFASHVRVLDRVLHEGGEHHRDGDEPGVDVTLFSHRTPCDLARVDGGRDRHARAELPLVYFNMARGQSDYFQATRGGGHGDRWGPLFTRW